MRTVDFVTHLLTSSHGQHGKKKWKQRITLRADMWHVRSTWGPPPRPARLRVSRHALSPPGLPEPRRRIGGKWSEGTEKEPSPVRSMRGSSSQTSRHTDRGARSWRDEEDVAHLWRAACRAVITGQIQESMHLRFLTSDELAPGVDSNCSRDSTGGMEDRLFIVLFLNEKYAHSANIQDAEELWCYIILKWASL